MNDYQVKLTVTRTVSTISDVPVDWLNEIKGKREFLLLSYKLQLIQNY